MKLTKVNLFLLILLMNRGAGAAPLAVAKCGKIVAATGRVQILDLVPNRLGIIEARSFELGMPSEVKCHEAVVTGPKSGVTLDIGLGVITLGEVSRYEFTAPPPAAGDRKVEAAKLLYGQLRASINKKIESHSDKNHFEIHTPTAVTGVRGTEFYLHHKTESGQTTEATIEGSVEVVDNSSGSKVLVGSGQQVEVGEKRAMGEEKGLVVKPISSEIITEIHKFTIITAQGPATVSEVAKNQSEVPATKVSVAGENNLITVEEIIQSHDEKQITKVFSRRLSLAVALGAGQILHQNVEHDGIEGSSLGFGGDYAWDLSRSRIPYFWMGQKSINGKDEAKVSLSAVGLGFESNLGGLLAPRYGLGLGLMENKYLTAPQFIATDQSRYLALVANIGVRLTWPLHSPFGFFLESGGEIAQSLFSLGSGGRLTMLAWSAQIGINFYFGQ